MRVARSSGFGVGQKTLERIFGVFEFEGELLVEWFGECLPYEFIQLESALSWGMVSRFSRFRPDFFSAMHSDRVMAQCASKDTA